MNYISKAMGWILAELSRLVGYNFAASVLIFTIIVNLLMLPITIKTQKSTAKQAKLKPKLDALKKKYGNDKQKYSQAMSELYSKEGVSMSGGCLPMIIRLFVMLGVYSAVISPLTYVQQINKDAIDSAKVQTQLVRTVEDNRISWDEALLNAKMADSAVLERAASYGSNDIEFFAKLSIVEEKWSNDEAIKKEVDSKAITQEIDLVKYLTTENEHYGTIKDVYKEKGGNIDDLDRIEFDLFGINLTDTPVFSWNFSNFQVIWLIPFASFATAMITSIISMRLQKKTNPDAPNMATMMFIMPLFSLFIAFKVPGAVGFYWVCSNVVSSGLQFTTQALYGPNVVLAKDQANNIIKRAKTEREKIDRVSKEDTAEN